MTRIQFQQTAETFRVEEELFYEPSGSGPYIFVKIQKRNCSTAFVKRKISEWTGTPLKHIRHAGMKDTLATAIQWLSWPESCQKRPLDAPANCLDDIVVLEQTRHENTLALGHVGLNNFHIKLSCDGPVEDWPDWQGVFPNYYGEQRFGGKLKDVETRVQELMDVGKDRFALSQLQSLLFNNWLRHRLTVNGGQPQADDLWTATNGKRFFETELDDSMLARFKAGEVVPTGPIYGYKNRHTPEELQFLSQFNLEPESFRKWGKIARGARRPLYAKPTIDFAEQQGENFHLKFSLPSGSYATVFLIHKFLPQKLEEEGEPVDFTQTTLLKMD